MISRLPSLLLAAAPLGVNCIVAFRVIPVAKGVFLDFQLHLPWFTQLVFDVGPAVLVTTGLLSAAVTIMGEFTPALRLIRLPVAILVLLLPLSAVASVFLTPTCHFGEIISPTASEPVAPAAATDEAEPCVLP